MRNYILTSVQYNAVVNKTLLKNMLRFADQHNVTKIYLFIIQGKYKDEDVLDPVLFEDDRFEFVKEGVHGTSLNSNLGLKDTKIRADKVLPLQGLQSKLHRDRSWIVPGAKVRFQSIANTSKHPRFLASTGALTHGNYKPNTFQGQNGALEHEYGFVFVEVLNERLFCFHGIEVMKNGNLNFDREFWKGGTIHDQQPEALVLGDWHCGETCVYSRKGSIQMLERLQPKRAILHDFFDGKSINRHEQHDCLSKARLYQAVQQDLKTEIVACLRELQYLAKRFPSIHFLVAESNHDAFLRSYLGSPEFAKDGQNLFFASNIISALETKGGQPILKTALELVGKIPSNVTFLRAEDEYRVRGVNLAAHGHKGVNGSRGSGKSFSDRNLKQITGHEHGPVTHPNGMVVGTNSILNPGYAKDSPSNWMHSNGLLYASGKYMHKIIVHAEKCVPHK